MVKSVKSSQKVVSPQNHTPRELYNLYSVPHPVSLDPGHTFYSPLCSFQCLEQCFHAEGNGLPLNSLHSDEYKVSN